MDEDDFWDEDDDEFYDEDDDIEPLEIDNWADSWPSCCGARMVHIPEGSSVDLKFPSVASSSCKSQAWQHVLNDADFGFLAIDQPYEGLTELIPGFWYFAGPGWEEHYRPNPIILKDCPGFWTLQSYQLFRDMTEDGPRTNKFNLITNFPYNAFDITPRLIKQLEKFQDNFNFAILAEDQISISEPTLLKHKFKVVNRFLNPYHEGTECALYMRQPGVLDAS